MPFTISGDQIASANAGLTEAHEDEYASLGRQLSRRGQDVEAVTRQVQAFGVTIPTWGVGTGGTRFARFAGPASRAESSRNSRIAAPSSA